MWSDSGSDREQCERVLAGWVQSVERLSAAGFEFPDYLPRKLGMFGWRWTVPEVLLERGLDREFIMHVEGVDLNSMYHVNCVTEARAEHAYSDALLHLGYAGSTLHCLCVHEDVADRVDLIDPNFIRQTQMGDGTMRTALAGQYGTSSSRLHGQSHLGRSFILVRATMHLQRTGLFPRDERHHSTSTALVAGQSEAQASRPSQ